jgi:hypothetical protein
MFTHNTSSEGQIRLTRQAVLDCAWLVGNEILVRIRSTRLGEVGDHAPKVGITDLSRESIALHERPAAKNQRGGYHHEEYG